MNAGWMDRVQMGMPSLLELPDFSECAALCASLGLRFVELNMNLPQYQIGAMHEYALRRTMDTHKVYCTLHLDERFAPCDLNPAVRAAYLQTLTKAIALAKRLRMPIVNLHLDPGIYFTLPDRKTYLFDIYRDHYLACLRALRTLCEDAIGGADIRVCVENCGGFAPYAQEGLDCLMESPAFALTLDIGHAHCAGDVDAPVYARHVKRLAHMHVHDASGDTCHLPLGTGVLPLGESLALAQTNDCRAVIEVKDVAGLRASIDYLREMA